MNDYEGHRYYSMEYHILLMPVYEQSWRTSRCKGWSPFCCVSCVVMAMNRVGDEAADNSVDPQFLDADKAIVAQVNLVTAHFLLPFPVLFRLSCFFGFPVFFLSMMYSVVFSTLNRCCRSRLMELCCVQSFSILFNHKTLYLTPPELAIICPVPRVNT